MRDFRLKLIILLAVVALLGWILLAHVEWVNGPSYWKWPPRHVPGLRWFGPMLLAVGPTLVAALGARIRAGISIVLLMISMLAMQLVAVAMPEEPVSLRRIIYTVESPTNLSYFTDADRSMPLSTRQLLSDYPRLMPEFQMHSQEKPPGPILFFRAILGIFGESDRTALIAGIFIGVAATLTIPMTHLLIKMLTNDSTAARFGACFVALAPGLVLHLPQMDQLYPIFTCALIVCWWKALSSNSMRWSAAFGAVLAIACLVVYHFLVLGAFLGALTIVHVMPEPKRRAIEALNCTLVSLAAFAGFYVILFIATGFNPIATFIQALHNQAQHLTALYRPYPKTIFDDLADFALGSGWIGWLLAIFLLVRGRAHPRGHLALALMCIGQIVLLAATGLMQTETARTWCFLLPLLAIPVGLELATWPRTPRFVVIVAMWLVLCLVGQNMKFIFKPAEQAPLIQSPPTAL